MNGLRPKPSVGEIKIKEVVTNVIKMAGIMVMIKFFLS